MLGILADELKQHARYLLGDSLQALLEQLALAHVLQDCQITHQLLVVADRRQGQQHRQLSAIAALQGPFVAAGVVFGQLGAEHGKAVRRRAVLLKAEQQGAGLQLARVEQLAQRLAVESLGALPEQLFGGRVEVGQQPLMVGAQQGAAGAVEQGPLQGSLTGLEDGLAAQDQLATGNLPQVLQGLALGRAEQAWLAVDDAEGTDALAVRAAHRHAGVETDMWRAGDQRVVAKARVILRVGHLKDLRAEDGMGTERLFARGFAGVQADPALEPLALIVY